MPPFRATLSGAADSPVLSRYRGLGQRYHCRQSDYLSIDRRLSRCTAKNNDDFPYIVQTWFDNGDLHIGPENASGIPFISTPPVFRIQPKSGQIVRVVYSQRKALPHDRESVFWFNALQVPPANIGGRQQNKVLVMLRTRIKLFYRPEGIGSPGNLAKNCTSPWCVMPEKAPVLSSAIRNPGMPPSVI